MKVADLIEQLINIPPSADVYLADWSWGTSPPTSSFNLRVVKGDVILGWDKDVPLPTESVD